MLFIILIVGRLLGIGGQFNLYETNRVNPLEFDCLHYYVGEDQFPGVRFLFPIYQKINYCRRPVERINEIINVSNMTHQIYTFKELRQSDITADQLLAWSASIDQAENYVLYRLEPNVNDSRSSEEFWNCTSPWFGSQCQYSFYMNSNITLADVVEITFSQEKSREHPVSNITNLTCYQLLPCYRGSPLCLDWREICNGRIDCEDGGADEEHCWQLELNECEPDEYRCHNGLCIPRNFVNDDPNNPDCLDRTDETFDEKQFSNCFEDPTFRCEEHMCHPKSDSFACGDGECQPINRLCNNRRQHLLGHAILAPGHLPQTCWDLMVCLANMDGRKPQGTRYCNKKFENDSQIRVALQTCPPLFQFPAHSLVHAHVRFLFFNNRTHTNVNTFFFPDWICYDRRLCDGFPSRHIVHNLTCLPGYNINTKGVTKYFDLMQLISNYFNTCSSMSTIKTSGFDTLYRCQHSSKYISKHRLLDSIRDCPMNDDEIYRDSCTLMDSLRFSCNQQDRQCYAPIMDQSVCREKRKDNYTRISFHQFCNRQDDFLLQTIDGFNHTDETDCDQWPCNNLYTRCDDYPHCPHREDEWGCIESDCPAGFHPCLSPINDSLICLSMQYFHDGHIHCLGASDEPYMCSKNVSDTLTERQYHCWNTSTCISVYQLCNTRKDCAYGDHERFCANRSQNDPISHTLVQLFNSKVKRKMSFSSENITAIVPTKPPQRNDKDVVKLLRSTDSLWLWRCNRGLYARFRDTENNNSFSCFCPPSYYGNFCEYQSQRISLTLEILTVDRQKTYTFVIRLVENGNRTVAYEQLSTMGLWGCDRSFNIYLLYPQRPKNLNDTYRIHIDTFDRSSLSYWGSWLASIPFAFLPVNRLAIQIKVPDQPLSVAEQCARHSITGELCCPYQNSKTQFCYSMQRCNGCSSDSLCVGTIRGKPICVCPMHKVGTRCLLDAMCPTDRCSHHGKCILLGHRPMRSDFICVCDEEYYGNRCQLKKNKLQISLTDIDTTQFIIAHHVTIYEGAKPQIDVSIQKLYRNQASVIFYWESPIHLVFIQIDHRLYFTHIEFPSNDNSSSLRGQLSYCPHVKTLLNPSFFSGPTIRWVKSYHRVCQNESHLSCFIEDYYMCLCTSERHANCFQFESYSNSTCEGVQYCQNGGTCYHDQSICPSQTLCICPPCYFGVRCQFYAKGFGVTLDDILRYEFRRSRPFSQQKWSVMTSAVITGFMFLAGSISSVLSLLTFRRANVQKVGCALYLLTISVTSFLTVTVLIMKFWFLTGSQLQWITNRRLLGSGCLIIEPLLKILFYIDSWLKACVSIERSFNIFYGVYFNQAASKRIARWIISILPIIITTSIIHEFTYRQLIDDEEGFYQTWCAVDYPSVWKKYNSFIGTFHFLTPFLINLFSTIFIIASLAQHRQILRRQHRYRTYLRQQFNEHKQTLISPIVLILLSSPRLFTSFMSSCIDSSHDPRWYLTGYFISFTPAVLTFAVFVLPSNFYRKEFRKHFHHLSDHS